MNAAGFLNVIAIIVGVLGGGISLLVTFLGFTPQCPAVDPRCLPSEQQVSVIMIAAGLAGTLVSLSAFALLAAIAARIKLAGVLALAGPARPASQNLGTPARPPAGPSQPKPGGIACMRCGSRNIDGGRCARCSAEPMTMTTSDGWYSVPGDPSRERFFNGDAWDPATRRATRMTRDDWHAPAGEWLVDPANVNRDRYWDGTAWTARVRDPWGDDEEEAPLT